ncbi:GNAT family N-acetyltransferase [Devosia sp. 1566]|uniref:GNAT family N-acetyltransferase n=1 Tax=Devosia sp. 1566 TaxID=2499144 RepID=UPI0020BE98F2|nr:GNAT family N-acetyltransferase [Devosia sp. 1566]
MSDTQYTVEREDGPKSGRYLVRLDGGAEAEMTYRTGPDGSMVIDHTGVPPQFEGRGIAARLVNAAISDARAEGFKITPLCSYVVAQFRRHPEWADLRA